MGVVGAAIKGFGKALMKGKKGIRSSKTGTIKIKPAWYVSASPNTVVSRKRILRTHLGLKRSDKVDKAVKDIKEGKKTLKHMEETGQAKELKDYKGKGTGSWHRKGFGIK